MNGWTIAAIVGGAIVAHACMTVIVYCWFMSVVKTYNWFGYNQRPQNGYQSKNNIEIGMGLVSFFWFVSVWVFLSCILGRSIGTKTPR